VTRARLSVGPVGALMLGVAAIALGTLVGWNAGALDAIVTPPPLVRAVLVGLSAALAVVLVGRSVGRLAEGGTEDVPGLVRAVRLAFLAVAAAAAGAGWALAHPLPLIIAAVIAGIDVIETSFLLIAMSVRGQGSE
jgi:hypothetical protein